MMRLPLAAAATVVLLVALPRTSGAQNREALPPEVESLLSDYIEERKELLLELDQAYLKKLAAALEKHSREGHVDAALAIRREMEVLQEEARELSEPEPPEMSDADKGPRKVTVTEDRPITITIPAKEENGVILENVRKGDEIILQYVSGRWKSHGKLPSENPDSIEIAHGQENRLAIFSKKTAISRLRPLAIVPADTSAHPFTYPISSFYDRVVLRINEDPDGVWESNPGAVIYRVQLKRADPQ